MKEIILNKFKKNTDLLLLVDDQDFEWLNQWNWQILRNGKSIYAISNINGKQILAHRLIMDAKSGQFIDHRDGFGLNCQRYNLRFCTFRENIWNSKPRGNSSSKYKGVTKYKKTWKAQININGKNIDLGHFNTEIDAARAFDAKSIEFRGEFAYLNCPDI